MTTDKEIKSVRAELRAAQTKSLLFGRPGFLIRRLHQIHTWLFTEETQGFNITAVQYSLLTALAEHGQMDQNTLALEIGLERSSVAEVLPRLEERGLLERTPSPYDGRVKLVKLSRKARLLVKRMDADVMTRREIVAPDSGTVVNQRFFTLGAVVKPGDPVMDLVPDHDRLIAEVNVQPYDIDVVYPGLRSEIRLPAFKQRLVPYLHGQVTWVAADVTTNDQTRQQYYRAYILIDPEQLASLPNVFLTPGMPVEAHVQIGERSFFRYITQPIRDSFHRAFREQ